MVPPPQSNGSNGLIVGQLNVNTLLVFAFGVIFIAVMLGFAVAFPNPTDFQYRVFIVVLALAAGGFGAMLPGSLGIEWGGVVAGIPLVKAGGALGLVALVLVFNPVIKSTAVRLVPPQEPPGPVALAYLKVIDAGDAEAGWSLLDDEAKGLVVPSKDVFAQLTKEVRLPLGVAETRALIGTRGFEAFPNMPLGLYNSLTYKVKFSSDGGQCRTEAVTLRATQDLHWRVFSHEIAPVTMPC